MKTATWVAPPLWVVPRDWEGERAFVLCGGASLIPQLPLLKRLQGRIIAVKQTALLRPDADVLFIAGEHGWEICRGLFSMFTHHGDIVARGRSDARFPASTKRIGRSAADRLSLDPTTVGGLDAGTSAINLAALRGATEIVVLGFDMTGGHWDPKHILPFPPQAHFDRHLAVLPTFAADCVAAGVRVVNVSPISVVTCFERQPLEAFL